jgi:hypothetical protein
MPRLFIGHVYAAPEHDEPPPVDARDDDTPAERAEYEARLATMRAKRDAEAAARAPTVLELLTRRPAATPLSPVKRALDTGDTDVDATPPPSPSVKRVLIERDALAPPLLSPIDVVDEIVDTTPPSPCSSKREHDADEIVDNDTTPPPSPRVKRRASPDVEME